MTTTTPPRALDLFVSFAPSDAELKDALLRHLSILCRIDKLNPWSVDSVRPGDDWQVEVDSRLGSADVALLLLSADSLASDFIQDVELPKLIERHTSRGLRLIPVVLRSCSWRFHPWIGKLSPLPKGGKAIASYEGDARDQVLSEVVEEIAKLAGVQPPAQTSAPDLAQMMASFAAARAGFEKRARAWRETRRMEDYMQIEVLPQAGEFRTMTHAALKELLVKSRFTMEPHKDWGFPWPFSWRPNQESAVEAESIDDYPPMRLLLHESGAHIAHRAFSEDSTWPFKRALVPGRLVEEVAASLFFTRNVAEALNLHRLDYKFSIVGANQRSVVPEVDAWRVQKDYGTTEPVLRRREQFERTELENSPLQVAARISSHFLALLDFDDSKPLIDEVLKPWHKYT